METEPRTQQPAPESQLSLDNAQMKRLQWSLIIGGILFLAFLIAAVVLMAGHPAATAVIRDIAIVFIAVGSLIVEITLIVLLFQLQSLIQMLRDETQPLLKSLNETANTLRGTSVFVSEHVAQPVIKMAGFTAGVQRVLSDLIAVVRGTRSRPKA